MILLQIGGITALVLGIVGAVLKFAVPKWIEQKFQERLEEFKRKQEEILETYRFEIQKMFNRAVKIHEKEYEILPEIWDKLQRANGAVNQALSLFSESIDFTKLNEQEAEKMIQSFDISDIQKDRLRKTDDKQKMVYNIQQWKKINYADETCIDFRNYYHLNKIFLDTKLQIEIEAVLTIFLEKYVHAKVEQQAMESGARMGERNHQDAKPIIEKIEKMIQIRLRFEEA